MRLTPLGVAAALAILPVAARAADMPAPPPAAGPCKTTLSFPAYGPLIKQNPNPACVTVPGIGDVYVGGILTGYGYVESNPLPFSTTALPSDASGRVDFSNLQAVIQKPDGPFQAFIQTGLYAIPSLGTPTFSTIDQTRLLFGPLPVAIGKYVFNDEWSIQGGRMPTLIGSESVFTFQNLNIARGLLFNQENVITQGVQVNWAHGPISASVAGTDGFFSGELSWFSGNVSYKIDDANTVGVNGGFNAGSTDVLRHNANYQYATPLFQQNSGIFDVNYTYSKGPWTVTPYFQFTNVERDPRIGIVEGASTVGGAVLAAYAFNDNFALAGRGEYIAQTGNRATGTTSLLYGPGSSAASFTITPTFTFDRSFVRCEYARVQLYDAGAGLGFGRRGDRDSQDRFLVEGGVTF